MQHKLPTIKKRGKVSIGPGYFRVYCKALGITPAEIRDITIVSEFRDLVTKRLHQKVLLHHPDIPHPVHRGSGIALTGGGKRKTLEMLINSAAKLRMLTQGQYSRLSKSSSVTIDALPWYMDSMAYVQRERL